MATFTVTTTGDSGAGSLRFAVAAANATASADTIVFDAALAGQTVALTSGELVLLNDVTIDGDVNGDDKADITISGSNLDRIFKVFDQFTPSTDVDLKSLTLTNGSARGYAFNQDDDGGAIYMRGRSLDIVDCTITNSAANYGGGGLDIQTGNVRIVNSLFTGNSSGSYGGAIRNFSGYSLSLVNSTLSGNSTQGAGGAIFDVSSGPLRLDNSTVTANVGGSGITTGYGSTIIVNSVVAGNGLGGNAANNDVGGTVTTANHSFFGTAETITTDNGSINGGGNPLLDALADNGGTVRSHAPLSGSPLINAGSNAALPKDTLDIDNDGDKTELLPQDGRGEVRILDGTVDIGAVESNLIVVTTAADVVNAGDGVISLREAVALANANADKSTIGFAAGLAGHTIVLTGGDLNITQDIVIDGDSNGDNKADITISGNNASRIFDIAGVNTDAGLLSLTLTNGNAAGEEGGAVRAVNISSLDIRDTTVSGNTASDRGGGVSARYSGLTVTNSLIAGNSAGSFGGGLYMRGNSGTLTNVTVHGNTSLNSGGGIGLGYAQLILRHGTITGNTGTDGGGIDNFGSSVYFFNGVLADNLLSDGVTENDLLGAIATATGSVFGTAVTITTNNGSVTGIADVGLGQLLDNGGTVLTRSPLDGSILAGAGVNGVIPADTFDVDGDGNTAEPLPLDGRGGVRIFGNTVDAGAVERIFDETIGGTAGNDTILGGAGTDALDGRGGDDTVSGGGDDDTLQGGTGDDTLNGGGGIDTADYSGAAGGVTVTLGLGGFQAVGGGLGSDRILQVENLTGGASGDTLTGDGNANSLRGASGNDTLAGNGGNDLLDGGSGNDSMAGGLGDDTYVVSALGDTVTEAAGQGDDLVQTGITHTLAANVERLKLTGGNAVNGTGTGGGNFINGNNAANVLTGLGGADRLDGEGGDDTMIGGDGDDIYFVASAGDTVTELANQGTDQIRSTLAIDLTVIANVENALIVSTANVNITGSGGGNALTGGNGANQINGGGGNDTVRGGNGADRLIGAAGADTFVWRNIAESNSFKQDRVDDFLTGADKLDLSAIDANFTLGGNQDFVLDTDASFSAGELRQTVQGANLLLEANIDNDATAEMAILFIGIGSLAAGDFL